MADPRTAGEELLLGTELPVAHFNLDGERFTSESSDNSYGQGDDQVMQQDQVAWAVFDARVRESLELLDPLALLDEGERPSIEELEDSGQLLCAESIEALALAAGMSPAGLESSVEALKQTIDEQEQDIFWQEVPEMLSITEPSLLCDSHRVGPFQGLWWNRGRYPGTGSLGLGRCRGADGGALSLAQSPLFS